MVGVPRSKACETCRKRRIKCDEIRPSCYQCRRGGRSCPGYGRSMKFVDEASRFQKQPRSTQYIEGSAPLNTSLSQEHQHRAQIVAAFVQDLFPLVDNIRQSSFTGVWLWLVPPALHESQKLDYAAEAVALAYFGKQSGSRDMLARSYSVYNRALRLLSKALQHHQQRFTSETLCAALLLLHYERFVSMESRSWISHAGGIRGLIQQRGPERHRTGLSRAILMVSRAYIISQCLLNDEACFLDDRDWKAVQFATIDTPFAPANYALYHEGLNYFASIPGFLQQARAARTLPDSDQLLVRATAEKLRSDMLLWYRDFEAAEEESVRKVTSDFDKNYIYRNRLSASFAISYSAFLILVNQSLDDFNEHRIYTEENRLLAKDIAWSTFYCAQNGFCGIQAMALALPIALTAAEEQDRDWIQTHMQTIQNLDRSLRPTK